VKIRDSALIGSKEMPIRTADKVSQSLEEGGGEVAANLRKKSRRYQTNSVLCEGKIHNQDVV
jgi:hypothetical protein